MGKDYEASSKKTGEMSVTRLKAAFATYISQDLAAAETDYVLEILQDICGLSSDEIAWLGFPGIVEERE